MNLNGLELLWLICTVFQGLLLLFLGLDCVLRLARGVGRTAGGGACPACVSPCEVAQAGHAPHVAGPACGGDEVKGRRTGSSEQLHRSGERSAGRSEPLNPPREDNARVKGQGESFSPPAL